MKRLNNKKGFTTVELVIVIAVIAILAGVLIPTFATLVGQANDNAAFQQARNAYTEHRTNDPLDFEENAIYIDADRERYVVIKGGELDDENVFDDITEAVAFLAPAANSVPLVLADDLYAYVEADEDYYKTMAEYFYNQYKDVDDVKNATALIYEYVYTDANGAEAKMYFTYGANGVYQTHSDTLAADAGSLNPSNKKLSNWYAPASTNP